MPRSKTATPKKTVPRSSKSAETSKTARKRPSRTNEAQLQFSITNRDLVETANDLELFLAQPERISTLKDYVVGHRPAYVFDLRSIPSFDGPHTSRRELLLAMQNAGARYLDVMAMVENEGSLAANVIEFCARTVATHALTRSVVFLFESMRDLLWSSSILPSAFIHHTSRNWQTNFIGVDLDPSSFENALRHWTADIPPVNRWMVGTVLHVAGPVSVQMHHGSYSHRAHVEQLARGSAVKVLATYSDFSAEVLVLSGPIRGETVRLPLMSNFARVVP